MVVVSLIFILGAIIGSFLNVCIYRLPLRQSVFAPPSRCFSCGARMRFLDLVPVFSYVYRRGHCRYCQAAISRRYPLVELLTAILFVWCYNVEGLFPQVVKAWLLTAFLIVIAFIDFDHQLIFDKVLAYLAVTGLVTNIVVGSVSFVEMFIASLLGGGLLLIIAIISRGGIGGGDIKFVAALALWLGWQQTLLAIFLSFLLGGVVGSILLLLRLKQRKDMIPFGPSIAVAAYIASLFGTKIIPWYIGRVFM